MSFIIPAIDLLDSKCVRLTEGAYESSKVYSESPLAMAKIFEDYGARRLHLVDLDGARGKAPAHLRVLEQIASSTSLQIDFSGGIRTEATIRAALASGARQVCIGSMAIEDSELFCRLVDSFGAESIILSADVRAEALAIAGWQEQSELNLFDFIDKLSTRIELQTVACTDISKDGRLEGPALELYSKFLESYPTLKLIASGGVASIADLEDLMELGVAGVIVGKAFYESRLPLSILSDVRFSQSEQAVGEV